MEHLSPPPPGAGGGTGPLIDRDEVLAAHGLLCAALVAPHVGLLDDLLDDAYTAVHITGHASPKAEWLELVRSGDFVYHSITDGSTQVEVDDDRARTTSTALYTVTLNGHAGQYRLRSTLDWGRRDDRWRALRGVATPA